MAGVFAGHNVNTLNAEVEKVKYFFDYFNSDKEDIVDTLKKEFTSELRIDTYFNGNQIKKIIDNGILNLKKEEIEIFSQIRFNDNQEEYLKNLISKNEKINVINVLDLSKIEASTKNKNYINLGGKNKTLKEIINPPKKFKSMR